MDWPWRPSRPVGPTSPFGPRGPGSPVLPVGPFGPLAPVVPEGPLGPCGRISVQFVTATVAVAVKADVRSIAAAMRTTNRPGLVISSKGPKKSFNGPLVLVSDCPGSSLVFKVVPSQSDETPRSQHGGNGPVKLSSQKSPGGPGGPGVVPGSPRGPVLPRGPSSPRGPSLPFGPCSPTNPTDPIPGSGRSGDQAATE